MANKTINVLKTFTLTHTDEGGKVVKSPFLPGLQDVDEKLADHWYTRAHCGELPESLKPKKEDKSKP